MSTISAGTAGRFYRDADRAMLGGVCAGLARYLGFNLRATRILAFIAFLMFMPFVVLAYLAIVFLVPAESSGETVVKTRRRSRFCGRRRKTDKIDKDDADETPAKSRLAEEIDQRCKSMDERLRILEKHVTSKRFQLEQELSRL